MAPPPEAGEALRALIDHIRVMQPQRRRTTIISNAKVTWRWSWRAGASAEGMAGHDNARSRGGVGRLVGIGRYSGLGMVWLRGRETTVS